MNKHIIMYFCKQITLSEQGMNTHDLDLIFQILIQNSTTCSILVDLDGKIIRYNEAYRNLIGYTDEEIRHKARSLYVDDEAYRRELSFMDSLLRGAQSDIKYPSSRLTKAGTVIQVEVTAILFRDHRGDPEFVLKRIEDITEKVQMDEANQNRLTVLKSILDEIPVNIYIKDKKSRFMMVSQSFVQFLGCKHIEDIIGKTDFDFFESEHAQQAFEDEQEILRTGKTVVKEEKEVHKDGSITYSLTSKAPLRDAVTREIIGTYGLSKDITDIRQAQQEVKKANEALEQKNNLLKQTIEELGRTQNKLVFAEKMAALGSLIGGIAHEINTPLGAIKASSTNISEVVEKINIDLPWLLNHASQDEIHWLFKFLTEADARDLSVFSREERKIKRELACLFEENNIPNAPIAADTLVSLKLGYTPDQYLRFLQQPNAERLLQILKVLFSLKRNANNIFISVEKAAKVVRALKSYIYKNAAGAFESTDLPETIHTVLILTANLIKHSKTEIITNFESVPVILCRQDEICQVWTNIITNAIQAMGENGQLKIGIHLKDNSHIEITFKDNGPGIPEDVQPHIFEPYFTTKAKGLGTGMGLDISKQIIESHNGHIRFESTPEEGTTFIVVIPIHQS